MSSTSSVRVGGKYLDQPITVGVKCVCYLTSPILFSSPHSLGIYSKRLCVLLGLFVALSSSTPFQYLFCCLICDCPFGFTYVCMYHAAFAARPFPLVAGVLFVDARSASIINFGVRIDGRFSMWWLAG